MTYELKHIRGIPYYLQGTTVFAFELAADGKPAAECIPLGTYDAESDTVLFADDWAERVQSRLDAYRAELVPQRRDNLRQTLLKPKKQSHSKRAPRKAPVRTKGSKSKQTGCGATVPSDQGI